MSLPLSKPQASPRQFNPSPPSLQAIQRSAGRASTSSGVGLQSSNGFCTSPSKQHASAVLDRRSACRGQVGYVQGPHRQPVGISSRVIDAPCKQQITHSSWPLPPRRSRRGSLATVGAAESSIPSGADGSFNSSVTAKPKGSSGFVKRVFAGVTLGALGALVITQGGVLYLAFMVFFIYLATREYFGFVSSIEVKEGLTPPPPWASALVTLCCMALPVYTFVTKGKIAVALAISSFIILSVIATTNEKPTLTSFAQAIFGLLYCGYLPSYWIKLRMLEIPALHTGLATAWPSLLGGLPHITVGFIATFTAIACIVAADCGAYFIGKNFGRTPLTRISPKKTVEGALGGLAASVGVALLLRGVWTWPLSAQAAVGLAVVIFLSSILGDIIESVMKRDAGLKDSGTLIPGHGGVLDRFDSYIFTGAVVHLYMKLMPFFGV